VRPRVGQGQLERGLAILRVDSDEFESGEAIADPRRPKVVLLDTLKTKPPAGLGNDVTLLVSLAYKF
jgi:hypothetical protein